MSSYKSVDLFGSGPHRFSLAKQGIFVIPSWQFGGSDPESVVIGNIELDVIVTGRLIAASDSALWTIRNLITAQAQVSAGAGTLIDQWSKSWSDMTLVGYKEADRTDRGRVVSVGYVATFRKLG